MSCFLFSLTAERSQGKVLMIACKSLNCDAGPVAKFRKMKTTILLFAVIFGCIAPTYSQLNRHRKSGTTSELFQNKTSELFQNERKYDFGNYKFDKFSGRLSYGPSYSLDILPTRPAPHKLPVEIYSKYKMPCFHPKSGDQMPWFKPTGTFHMRVFKPNDVNWGILY